MAPDNSRTPSGDAVEAAIMRVLAAEATARDAIARSRDEAAAIAEQAREKARALRLVTDRRIGRLRAAFDARCTAEVAALEDEAAALAAPHDPSPAEVAGIERAVAALARALTESIP
jgi:hypothetical protein